MRGLYGNDHKRVRPRGAFKNARVQLQSAVLKKGRKVKGERLKMVPKLELRDSLIAQDCKESAYWSILVLAIMAAPVLGFSALYFMVGNTAHNW